LLDSDDSDTLAALMADPRTRKNGPEKASGEPVLHTRWWIDQGKTRERQSQKPVDGEVAGASFFRVGIGYDQDTARTRLTDLNLKLLEEGNTPAQGWGYLQMTPDRFSPRQLEQIKRAIPLGPGLRALAVDSGVSLRVILTGTPTGARLLELRFGEESSFDAWVQGEWVEEMVFSSLREAIRATTAFVNHYLASPETGAPR
jgi:hypothetical protein